MGKEYSLEVTDNEKLHSEETQTKDSTEDLLENLGKKLDLSSFYLFISMGLLCIVIPICLGLFLCQKKKRVKQKKHPDMLGRGVNQITPQQPFGFNRAEKGAMQNSTPPRPLPLSSETIIYNNDAWLKVQVGPKVIYSNQDSEENQSGLVYASLNHSVNEVNFLRRGEHVYTKQPTEHASICVKS
ncbi:LOW QUALITY PROTEIN: B- and T-lymphocyte attenuator [Macrotis lagotis]|uniref:LOW QUALITY PROTEIN: B- and T-lymphocyte attenuator n=1 Tax=Macrotis lagotis TaxID=92651 RepID=UPI003D69B541